MIAPIEIGVLCSVVDIIPNSLSCSKFLAPRGYESIMQAVASYYYVLSHRLQVVHGPDSKGNCQGDTTKGKDENGSIPSIQCGSNTIPHLFGIPTTRSTALWASESRTLFFKVHSGWFVEWESSSFPTTGECVNRKNE